MLKDLAAELGVSPSMVSRLAKRGMPTDTVERARRWRRRHLELARTKAARPEQAPGAADDDDDALEDELPAGGAPGDESTAAYREARAQREQLRLERERLELARLRGSLIDAAWACREAFTAFRTIRDRIEAVPDRHAAELHALVLTGGTAEDLRRALAGLIRDELIGCAGLLEGQRWDGVDADDAEEDERAG